MEKIIKIATFSLLVVIILTTGVSVATQQGSILDTKRMPQNITDTCKKDKEFFESIHLDPSCLGKEFRCSDGWNAVHYFDGSLFTKEIKLGVDQRLDMMYAPEDLKELKNATIAIQGTSHCNCVTPVSYTVLRGEKEEAVTCEEFYKFIEEYNAKCNSCVKKVGEGCC